MTGLPLVSADQAPLLSRPFYAGGDPGSIVAALAHVPEILEVAMPFLGTVLGPSSIPTVTKEIVILRTSVRAGCQFCVQSHTLVALDSGLSHLQVQALRNDLPVSAAFDHPADVAVIDWVDLVAGLDPVDDSARAAIRSHFADHVVVELTVLVATTLFLNRLATSLELPVPSAAIARLVEEGMA